MSASNFRKATAYSDCRSRSVLIAGLRLVGDFLRGLLAGTVLLGLTAGLPWALVHFVGWPLPDHVPSRDEIQATLLNPMTQQFLLNSLAVLCWIVWFVFAIDVLRCSIDTARGTTWSRLRPPGPLHALAAALIGTIVLTLLGNRTPFTTPTTATTLLTGDLQPAAVSAPQTPGLTGRAAQAPPGMVQATEEVRPPQDGIYDSLWRIAERIYGTGHRWPELFQLNRGIKQPDGRALIDPNVIRPGWKITAYVPALVEPRPQPQVPPPSPPPKTTHAAPPSTTPTGQPDDERSTDQAEPGLSLMSGAFVSIGLAALAMAALITTRLHRRRRYRPGVPEPDDPGRAPIVRALRIAYDSMTLPTDNAAADVVPTTEHMARDQARAIARAAQQDPNETEVGVRDGHTVALNLARGRGLGLTGPGARAAARTLIVSILAHATDDNSDALMIIPTAEAHALFGQDIPARPSPHLRVVDTLTTALNALEAEMLKRMRRANGSKSVTPTGHAPIVLIATPTADTERRTQAILDNGSAFNLTGIILRPWRPGGTIRVREDGTVSATSPNLDNQLTGTRLFTLPTADAADLLTLFQAAEPATPSIDYEFPLPNTNRPQNIEPPPPDTPPLSTPDEQELATTPDTTPLHFQVLGRLHLTHAGTDLINLIAPRQREILVYLALHRDGCRRESLTTALWPDAPGDRPYNSFHATLSQLRRALRKATNDTISTLIANDDGHYQLDKTLVTVDLWQLQEAFAACRQAPTPSKRTAALQRVAGLYRGDLADGITADWIDPIRESLRREALDALSSMIRAVDNNPEQMHSLLEQARGFDPYNEAIYRDIMRVQARLGRYDSIPRTLSSLRIALAELDERPTSDTVSLANFLCQRPAEQQCGGQAS